MNNRRLSRVKLLRAVAAVYFVACPVIAQEKAAGNIGKQLMGAWTLVSQYTLRDDGSRFGAVGSNPKGILIYDESGRMSVQIIEASIPKFAAGNRLEGTAE